MKNSNNFIHPFLLAPLVAAICFVMFDVFFGTGIKQYDGLWDTLESILFGILFFYFCSLFFSFTIGILSFYIVRYIWKITWYIAFIGGFIDGVIGAVIINYSNNAKLSEAFELDYLLPYAIYGAVTGLAFWIIWKKLNLDTLESAE
jgi:hypothetical protein